MLCCLILPGQLVNKMSRLSGGPYTTFFLLLLATWNVDIGLGLPWPFYNNKLTLRMGAMKLRMGKQINQRNLECQWHHIADLPPYPDIFQFREKETPLLSVTPCWRYLSADAIIKIQALTLGIYNQQWDSDTFSDPQGNGLARSWWESSALANMGLGGQKESMGISPRKDWFISLAFHTPKLLG